jgi:type I restriction-modification system DNA methylase subunit
MNREQARNLVQQTFTQKFDKARLLNFLRNLLNHIDESKASSWNSQYVKDAFKNHVQRYERLGTYHAPGKEAVDLLVVYLTNESKLERARTAIRNFVADHLKTRDEKDAALVAFVSPTEATWRFSYVKMEYAALATDSGKIAVEAHLTPARRFSYIVGEGESCHTAQSRFLDLLENTQISPSLAEIEEAFSVEAVTKEFFTKYAELFEDIHKALDRLIAKDKTLRDEFNSKRVTSVEFAKKLMGQIVFLYFLQKKGWLGVSKGNDWGSGSRDFLRRLAKGEYGKYENFFNDVLEPLFYDTLATDRGHEAWCEGFKCRIPFLNGGLFEPLGDYNWRKTDIALPNKLFTNANFVDEGVIGTGVLDVFDRYNFTVNEAEPLEKEVAIDPEMLGKVFENLIEENRRKGLGAYYTPREIVHYMCQESLINYLDTSLNGDKENIPRPEIETFVHLGEQISHYEAVKTRYAVKMPKSIEQHARQIDESLAAITICDPAVGSGAFPVGMMTEVVRARNALTPYFNDVHERTPYYFKRHAIQNCLYGVDIDPGAVEIAKLRLWLSLVVDEEETKQIKPLPNLLYKAVTGDSLLGVEKTLFNARLFRQLEQLKPLYFDESDFSKKASLKHQIDDIIHELTHGKATFDFQIYFSEVFHKKRGFDVVIANPPYIQLSKVEGVPDWYKQHLRNRFHTSGGRLNTFIFFIHLGLELLKPSGSLAFIIPNTILTQEYYSATRELLLKHNRLRTVVQYSELPFENAVVENATIVATKEELSEYPIQILTDDLRERKLLDQKKNTEFLANPKFSISINADKVVEKVFATHNRTLGEFCDVNQAIALIGDRSLSLRNSNPAKKYYKVLDGRNIGRYWLNWNGVYLDYKLERIHSCKRKDIFESPEKLFFRRVSENLIFAYDDEQFFALNTLVVVNARNHSQIVIKYLLALLNSKLMNYLYRRKFKSTKTVFSEIQARTVRQLPIPFVGSSTQAPLISLVERILAKKRNNPEADTMVLEQEIDCLVYSLYNLTNEEIAIVESSVGN